MDWSLDKGGYFSNTRDRCGCGAAMTVYVDGVRKTYAKGIGTHAPAQLDIDLEGKGFTTFKAQAGISACQAIGGRSDVNFVVKADGVEIFRKNAVLAGQSYPVELDVTGVKTLSLITETNGPDYNDHALWADAKLVAGDNIAKKGLEKLVAMVEELDASEYSAESWAAVAEAAEEAKALLNAESALQEDFDAAVGKLVEALGNLEYGVQKLHLEVAIEAAEKILALGKNYEDIDALTEAVDAGKTVLSDENASQEDVDNAAYAVLNELFKMAKTADISSLESLIEAALKAMLIKANEVLDNAEAYVAEVRLLGDVNGDGDINTADSAAELDTLSSVEAASADVNGDGAADTNDAVMILQYTAEKIAAF